MDMLTSMNNAIEYIEENLMYEIKMSDLSKAACCSQWYLQRMFMSITDVSISEYIRRRRLTLAAFDLLNSKESVTDIALKYGYNSPDAFGRAFKALHGVTPTKARNGNAVLKSYGKITFVLSIKGVTAMNYRIEEKQPIKVIGVKKWFSTVNNQQFKEIPKMWDEFPEEKCKKLLEIASEQCLVGLCADMYNNGFDYWIGTMSDSSCPEGFEEITIPKSSWAIFEVIGPLRPLPNRMQDIWGRIYSEWLPNSGYKHAEIPEIEYYTICDNMSSDYKSEIWIPIKK